MRQAGLVNLWFFLKVIAGAYGAYNELDDDLNLDMCNWRQSDACMAPGARFMALMPRGFRKSTIFSHGANSWMLTRDSEEAIRLVNAIISRAEGYGMRPRRPSPQIHCTRRLRSRVEASRWLGHCFACSQAQQQGMERRNNGDAQPTAYRT